MGRKPHGPNKALKVTDMLSANVEEKIENWKRYSMVTNAMWIIATALVFIGLVTCAFHLVFHGDVYSQSKSPRYVLQSLILTFSAVPVMMYAHSRDRKKCEHLKRKCFERLPQ
jgi:hypothetical protein